MIAALATASAAAQVAPPPTTSPFGPPDENKIIPKSSYPLGRSDVVAQGMAAGLRVEQIKRDLCAKFGCLVVRNESRNYLLTGFYVQMPAMRGTDRWGPNQLDEALAPRYSMLRVKTGEADACALPVRFELRKKGTGQRATVLTQGNFCMTPNRTDLLDIRVVEPRVIVEPSD